MNPLRQAQLFWKSRRDWLGQRGVPVSPAVAQSRAMTCLDCPRHDTASPIEEAAKRILVRMFLNVKQRLGLSVEREKELHLCGICGCVLETKIWQPLHVSRDETPDWSAFPDNCWLKTEQPLNEDEEETSID